MYVIVEIKSNFELGLASEETCARFQAARAEGFQHILIRNYSGEHKVVVARKAVTRKELPPRDKRPLFFDPEVRAPKLGSKEHQAHFLSRTRVESP